MQTFLSSYRGLLLDMNGTFMFGEDRFGPEQDFAATYRQLGGRNLPAALVQDILRRTYEGMGQDYADPRKVDDFPSLADGLRRYGGAPEGELAMLAATFAQHELGRIPEDYAGCLQRLARSHRLGLVANIWARKEAWLKELERAGVADLWQCQVFSSDGRSIKPSSRLFHEALSGLGLATQEVLFVGDDLHFDVAGASACGIDTAWIDSRPSSDGGVTDPAPSARPPVTGPPVTPPTVTVPSLLALESLPARA